MRRSYEDSTAFITGGTGSWGRELTRQLLAKGIKKVVIFSRGELAQVQMKREFNDGRIHFHIGDVRDYRALNLAMHGATFVFHLAALKHVPVCEEHPEEAILTNIDGTRNVCEAAIANKVRVVVDVSTDKAVAPVNLYGMTKAIGERLMLQANRRPKWHQTLGNGVLVGGTNFICIRGGNAIGSNGSAIPLFVKQVKTTNRITVTDFRMTRYFMTLQDAVGLIFKAFEHGIGGVTYVMKMPAFSMKTIAEVIAARYGDRKTQIVEIGIRPGEKLDEVLISADEARLAYRLDDDYYVIIPDDMADSPRIQAEKMKPFGEGPYTSATELSSHEVAHDTLVKSGFIEP